MERQNKLRAEAAKKKAEEKLKVEESVDLKLSEVELTKDAILDRV